MVVLLLNTMITKYSFKFYCKKKKKKKRRSLFCHFFLPDIRNYVYRTIQYTMTISEQCHYNVLNNNTGYSEVVLLTRTVRMF